jgi:hypothetical protein
MFPSPLTLQTDPRHAAGQAAERQAARSRPQPPAPVAVCVLLYGDYLPLAERAISSIFELCPREDYSLIVGANAVGAQTLKFIRGHEESGAIDRLIVSDSNLNKCPMMRLMFEVIESDFIWWFDDDSSITEPSALSCWLQRAQASPASTVMWGQLASCDHGENFTYLPDPVGFVRNAPWYRGLPPPSWRPGGKGEFNHENKGTGDGRWFFVTGGCWMIRTSAVRALDWPDPRLVKMGDDVFLGEAIRQQGWQLENLGELGITIGKDRRRGSLG